MGEAEPGEEGATAWPSTWREDMASGDTKAAELLKRFPNPTALAKSWLAAQQRIRTGEYKRAAPPDGGDDAAVAAWREEQGIPAEPDAYDLPLPRGATMDTLPETVREGISAFKEGFHKANLTADQAKMVHSVAQQIAERQMEAQALSDAEAQDAVDDTLRADWGPDYRTNIRMNYQHMAKMFGEDVDSILVARLPDGRRLADLATFNKAMNAWARTEGTDILIEGEGHVSSIAGRRAEIEKIMATDFNRYRREKLDEEYARILEKQEASGKL